ncbi:MAG: hypothetical protein ABI665_00170 [Vicinamibacterales bacterium]
MSREFDELNFGLQPSLQPAAPSGETPTSAPSGDGRFQPGNRAALRHGARSARVAAGLMPEQAEAAAALGARVAAIVADLGGPEGLSALAVGQAERHARLELVDEYLWRNLEANGVLTGKGRQRAALTAWLAVIDRLQKSAMALGLERRARRVQTLGEIMSEHEVPK